MFIEQVQSSSLRSQQKEETHHRVLDAAATLFIEQGYERTSIRQIAQAAGVSVGTVARSGDKKHLLIEVFAGWIASIHQHDQARTRANAERTLPSALKALLEPAVSLYLSNSQLTREAIAMLVLSEERHTVLDELAGYLQRDVSEVLKRFNPDDNQVEADAALLYHLFIGVVFAWALGRYSDAQFQAIANATITHVAQRLE